ncbi:hypothetical protein PGH26_12685 [Sporosarcina jeotgali]|uniref:Uncharacterized protein n=1 Tax=Sporosarcina jeotgali TaxID=3020056 RepID=A0ABZ0KWB5_9BACL|nr:hypothetical protein [Sporosarcina sp. B2O-1]WOV83726.1 hypothetical protein PGH26_12685 [Sporosarcina sp. B2O-1]
MNMNESYRLPTREGTKFPLLQLLDRFLVLRNEGIHGEIQMLFMMPVVPLLIALDR